MNPAVVLPALTSILALVFALALFDQWRERRGGFQLIWTFGMVFYGVGAGCEAIAAASGWNEGAVPHVVPDRRGLDGRLAGARDRVSCWAGRGSATASRCASSWPACSRSWSATSPNTPGAGTLPLLYFIAAGLLALAVAVETYFANDRWPILAAAAVVGRHAPEHRAHGDHDAGRAGLRGRSGDRRPGRDALPALASAADAVPEHHRRVRADPRRGLLDLRVHAQAARPGLLARSRTSPATSSCSTCSSRRSRSS